MKYILICIPLICILILGFQQRTIPKDNIQMIPKHYPKIEIDTFYYPMFIDPIFIVPDPITIIWMCKGEPKRIIYHNKTAYSMDGVLVTLGFRSDGVVVWREIE